MAKSKYFWDYVKCGIHSPNWSDDADCAVNLVGYMQREVINRTTGPGGAFPPLVGELADAILQAIGKAALGPWRGLILAIVILGAAFGQTYNISTFAGGSLPENIPATSVSLGYVSAVAVDRAGNVFLCANHVVMRRDAITGILTRIAGTGTLGYSGDNGPATAAQLNLPTGVAVDAVGNIYISDGLNY